MYPYIVLSDETEITHSHIINRNARNEVEVHFERPMEAGFDSARCILPTYEWINRDGFTDSEVTFFEQLMQHNAHLFLDMQRKAVSKLPSLFNIGGYRVFFWSNENNEPIHVHICEGKPLPVQQKSGLHQKGDAF